MASGSSARISAAPPAKPGRGGGVIDRGSRARTRGGTRRWYRSARSRPRLRRIRRRLPRCAVEQGDELLGVDRLALEQDLRQRLEVVAALVEDVLGGLVGLLDDAADLVVDLAGDLVGVVGLGGELAAEERLTAVVSEHARAEALRHAVAHDHLLGRLGDLLEVVGGAGRDLVEDDLLGRATAERHRHRVGELGPGGQELVLGRQRDRVAERLAAADDRNLVDRVAVRQQMADDRVPELVVGGDRAAPSRPSRATSSRVRRSPA